MAKFASLASVFDLFDANVNIEVSSFINRRTRSSCERFISSIRGIAIKNGINIKENDLEKANEGGNIE